MSLLTAAFLMDKYGPLLTIDNLGEVLHLERGTVKNQISAQRIGIPVIRHGSKPLFHATDVATYIDGMRPS
jgi:hypothetical protein